MSLLLLSGPPAYYESESTKRAELGARTTEPITTASKNADPQMLKLIRLSTNIPRGSSAQNVKTSLVKQKYHAHQAP